MSQMLHLKFELDPGTSGVGGGNQKSWGSESWKTLRVMRSG